MTDDAATSREDWFRALLLDPAKAYRAPSDVLVDERLSRDDRLEVLKAWEQDATRLADAVSEGMGGGEPNMLREVMMARLALENASG